MIYEMKTRNENEIGHSNTLLTFEEFVILYLNNKPQIELKFCDVRQAFDKMVANQFENDNQEENVPKLSRESLVHMMKNMG